MPLMLPAPGPGPRLIDVVPQMSSALESQPGSLGLAPARSAVIVLLDGLGARNIAARAGHARFLAAAMGKKSVAQTVFPSTTSAALTTLLTGTPPGEHGIVGYRALVPERDIVSNQLVGYEDDGLDPMTWQRSAPLFEIAADAGHPRFVATKSEYRTTGFTRATMRGAEFHGAESFTDRLRIARELSAAHPDSLTYVYASELDSVGHRFGWESDRWITALEDVDAALSAFAGALHPRTGVIVTADHGMVDVPRHRHVLLGVGDPRLDGVRHVGGEPRMLHLYLDEGSDADGLAETWRATDSERAWIMTRTEAIAAGLFGDVDAAVAPRIGDVLVAAKARWAFYDDRDDDNRAQSMIGQHGSLTPEETTVPLIRLGAFARP